MELMTMLGLANFALTGAKAAKARYDRYKNPQQFRKTQWLKQNNMSDEQYGMNKRNLSAAMAYLANPQKFYQTQQAQLPQQGGTQPQVAPIGGQPKQQALPSLVTRLQGLEQIAASNYNQDRGSLEGRLSQLNPMGAHSASTMGLLQDVYMNNLGRLTSNQNNLVSRFRNQTGIEEIEGNELDLNRSRINQEIQNQQANQDNQEYGANQNDYFSQQDYNIGQSGMKNIWANDQYRRANQRLQQGLTPRYSFTQATGGNSYE